MAGVVAVVGMLGAGVVLGGSLLGAASASVWSQRLTGAADAAALAAADAASGAVAGVPCERAEQLARLAGAQLASCEIEGLVATVAVSASFGLLPAVALARAGPPPEPAGAGSGA